MQINYLKKSKFGSALMWNVLADCWQKSGGSWALLRPRVQEPQVKHMLNLLWILPVFLPPLRKIICVLMNQAKYCLHVCSCLWYSVTNDCRVLRGPVNTTALYAMSCPSLDSHSQPHPHPLPQQQSTHFTPLCCVDYFASQQNSLKT